MIEFKRNRVENKKKLKVLTGIGLIGVAIAACLGYYFNHNSQEPTLLDQLDNPISAYSIPCEGYGSSQNSVTSPTPIPPTLSPITLSTAQAIQEVKKASIAATVTFQQTAPESADVFGEFDPDYVNAAVRVDLNRPEGNFYFGSGLVIGKKSIGIDPFGMEQDLVFVLTHNHPQVSIKYNEIIEKGEQPRINISGVDKKTKKAVFLGSGPQVGCIKVFAGGEYAADIIAIKTTRSDKIIPYPKEIGGPCLNKDGSNPDLQMISWSLIQDRRIDGSPLGSHVDLPILFYEGIDTLGIQRRVLYGFGNFNPNGSGSALEKRGGIVCGVVNYYSLKEFTIGWNTLAPPQLGMPIYTLFQEEQVKKFYNEK